MKKIIIIQHEPLTYNIEKKYCLTDLLSAGFYLEYWDISQLLYPGIKAVDGIDFSYLKKINTFEDFVTEFNKISNDSVIVPEFFMNSKTKKLWKLLCSSGLPLIKIERYANSNIKKSILQKIVSNFTPKRIIYCLKKICFNISLKIDGINGYNYLLTSGNKTKCDQEINHPDYDEYLIKKNDAPFLSYKYICFIDTGFGIHPDQKYYMENFSEDNELWQKKLSIFFDKVEKKFGIPVVIAVHPKIEYSENAFGGRKKIKYQTLNLVLNSEFVLQDISNSLSYSVIADKKIGIIVTNEMWKYYKYYLSQLTKKLNIPLFSIDKDSAEIFLPQKIPYNSRLDYMNDFLCTKNTKDKLTSELLIDFFKKI